MNRRTRGVAASAAVTSMLGLFAALPLAVVVGVTSAHAQDEGIVGDDADAETRQRPGHEPRHTEFPPFIYESIPAIESSASEFVATPDRWRQFYQGKWYDPYNQNVLKADIPIFGEPGHEWFFELSVISDTLNELRNLPMPVGGPSTNEGQSTDQFGEGESWLLVQNVVTSFALIKGNTTFKPPDIELRATPVFNINYVDIQETGGVNIDPSKGTERTDNHVGFQDLFVDLHLGNLTDRYDFISTRAGIQRFQSDFRGFVYADDAPGVRLFGNYGNNIYQYNLAWFHRLDKDTNSQLNTFDSRHEDVFIANLYRQDTPVLGHTMQFNIVHRQDRAAEASQDYDANGFLVRPASIGDEREKNLHSTHFGLTGDGHFGRLNTTAALYYVTGKETHNPIAQQSVDISAGMAALEASYDIDYIRVRGSALWASGDDDPRDGTGSGFDSVFDNPNFAGGDISFFQRQGIPLIGGGGVNLVSRNSLFPNLRPGKEEGQSNFVNPGIRLLNLGVDFEVTPKFKIINNVSYLQFDQEETLELVRQDGSVDRDIGWDLSSGILYRPFLNNNVQLRFGTAFLIPDDGVKGLFGNETLYSIFSNVIFQY